MFKLKNLLLITTLILSSCSTNKISDNKLESKLKINNYSFVATSFNKINDWDNQDFVNSFNAFKKICIKLNINPLWKNICLKSKDNLNNIQAKLFFEKNFTPWAIKLNGHLAKGLATGYYQPIIKGSLTKNPYAYFPIYGVPIDLITVPIDNIQKKKSFVKISITEKNKGIIKSNGKYKANLNEFYLPTNTNSLIGRISGNKFIPYYSRLQINSGILNNKAPILAYASDPVDLFFMHIQGSGIVKTENNYIHLKFANNNGLPFQSIANYMDNKGYLPLPKFSKENIKQWFKENPNKLFDILSQNPRYVFYEKNYINNNSVVGSLGIPLTDEYSAAVDKNFIQLGSPIFISTTNPKDKTILNRLIIAQDTGDAIKGNRIDYFFGTGEKAKELASKMKYDVYIWVLVPKGKSPKILN